MKKEERKQKKEKKKRRKKREKKSSFSTFVFPFLFFHFLAMLDYELYFLSNSTVNLSEVLQAIRETVARVTGDTTPHVAFVENTNPQANHITIRLESVNKDKIIVNNKALEVQLPRGRVIYGFLTKESCVLTHYTLEVNPMINKEKLRKLLPESLTISHLSPHFKLGVQGIFTGKWIAIFGAQVLQEITLKDSTKVTLAHEKDPLPPNIVFSSTWAQAAGSTRGGRTLRGHVGRPGPKAPEKTH